jgi:hypothetical protein
MTDPTFYKDATAVTARALEVPNADFLNGMNAGGACAPGLGINIDGGAVDPEHFSLLDQHEAIRVPQDGQQIGGLAFVDRTGGDDSSGGVSGVGVQPILTATNQTQAAKDADSSLDGVPVITGDANLQTLSAGWVDTAI